MARPIPKTPEESRAETLARRILHQRENEKVADAQSGRRLGHHPPGCSPESVRCPEARIMTLDTPECCQKWIRQILRDVGGLLDKAGIRWWIDYGTVLGYVRNGGLIPWDKDTDLGILAEDRDKLLGLRPEIEGRCKYHCRYAPIRRGQRFRTCDRLKVCLSESNRTNVDIFIWEEDRPKKGWLDRICYIGSDLYKGREMPKEMILPLGRGLWDGIEVSVPNDPEGLCLHRYGPNWREPERSKHPAEVRP